MSFHMNEVLRSSEIDGNGMEDIDILREII